MFGLACFALVRYGLVKLLNPGPSYVYDTAGFSKLESLFASDTLFKTSLGDNVETET